jgi:hypothetical protein
MKATTVVVVVVVVVVVTFLSLKYHKYDSYRKNMMTVGHKISLHGIQFCNSSTLEHPAYSPDMFLRNYYTYPVLKQNLRNHRFQEDCEIEKTREIVDNPREDWNRKACAKIW